MSATSFLRQRRAVALKYISTALISSPDLVAAIMGRFNLDPNQLAGLGGNNDVLTIADDIAAAHLDEEELDSLETLGTITVGNRSAVHSPDVRRDQFTAKLQHPSAETVGVGNMHDGPQTAEDLANVGSAEILAIHSQAEQAELDPSSTAAKSEAAAVKADGDDALVSNDLPAFFPSTDPAAKQLTAEDEHKPTDPAGTQDGVAATPVDLDGAAKELAAQAENEDKLAAAGEGALEAMDRDALIEYAAKQDIDLGEVTTRTTPAKLRERILAAQGAAS